MKHILALLALLAFASAHAAETPNVIVILADDQGSVDLGCYGAKDLHAPHYPYQAKPKDRVAISLANWNGTQYATDWIEYDIAFSPNMPKRHLYYSTLEGNNSKPFGPLFKPNTGVDQHGRHQSTGPGIADGKSLWEHRIIGFASTAPGPLGKHGVVFIGGQAGTYTIYLDNLPQ